MKCWWEFISNAGMSEKVIRRAYDLPNITAEEFDASVHMGKIFMYPETGNGAPPLHGIYAWKVAIPENDDEEEKLISLGKWQRSLVKQHGTQK